MRIFPLATDQYDRSSNTSLFKQKTCNKKTITILLWSQLHMEASWKFVLWMFTKQEVTLNIVVKTFQNEKSV